MYNESEVFKMIEVGVTFKKGYEYLYERIDKLFTEDANMEIIKQGVYRQKPNGNPSKTLIDSCDCIDQICEAEGYIDVISDFYQIVGREVTNLFDYYEKFYKNRN